ncbi:UMP kinase [Candidatus Latescibacterota bacterium]
MAIYKRILLKLSGEALSGEQRYGFDKQVIASFCRQIKEIHEKGVQIALVVGGGNIFRGMTASGGGMKRVTADHMGMLATVINGLALQDELEKSGMTARVLSAFAIEGIVEPFNTTNAVSYLETGQIVIFVGGTGNPYFSTDTAASLRAAQINADSILKGTKVDGVFDADPVKVGTAKKFDTITFNEMLSHSLKVMDSTAIAMCRENNIPIIVFNLTREGTLLRVINGEPVGTIVKEEANG